MRRQRVFWSLLTVCVLAGLILSGCTGASTPSVEPSAVPADDEAMAEPTEVAEPVQETEESQEEVELGDFGVPADAADVVNPIPADESSVQRGEEVFKTACTNCHGEEGRGDGPVAVAFDPKPLDFRDEKVKELSDGELFYIITNGIEETAMSSWSALDEEDRWHLVNYIRTFQE